MVFRYNASYVDRPCLLQSLLDKVLNMIVAASTTRTSWRLGCRPWQERILLKSLGALANAMQATSTLHYMDHAPSIFHWKGEIQSSVKLCLDRNKTIQLILSTCYWKAAQLPEEASRQSLSFKSSIRSSIVCAVKYLGAIGNFYWIPRESVLALLVLLFCPSGLCPFQSSFFGHIWRLQYGTAFFPTRTHLFQGYSLSTKYLKHTFQTWSSRTVSMSYLFDLRQSFVVFPSVCGTHQWSMRNSWCLFESVWHLSLKACGSWQRVVTFRISTSKICWFRSAVVLEKVYVQFHCGPANNFHTGPVSASALVLQIYQRATLQ